MDFLTLNRTAIVNLLPHLDKQKGLDGAWTKRFLLAVKEISPESADDVERKVIFPFSSMKGVSLTGVTCAWSIRSFLIQVMV